MDVPLKTNWKTGHGREGRREGKEGEEREREGETDRQRGRQNINVNINMAESQAATEFLDGSDRK